MAVSFDKKTKLYDVLSNNQMFFSEIKDSFTYNKHGSSFIGTFGDDNLANVLTDCGDPDNKDGIGCVLKLVVEILSIGVGILAVVGISVSGIQYLTAGGSEEKTRKAKRRIFEIVIGLAAYAVMYALLQWLLPGFQTG